MQEKAESRSSNADAAAEQAVARLRGQRPWRASVERRSDKGIVVVHVVDANGWAMAQMGDYVLFCQVHKRQDRPMVGKGRAETNPRPGAYAALASCSRSA